MDLVSAKHSAAARLPCTTNVRHDLEMRLSLNMTMQRTLDLPPIFLMQSQLSPYQMPMISSIGYRDILTCS